MIRKPIQSGEVPDTNWTVLRSLGKMDGKFYVLAQCSYCNNSYTLSETYLQNKKSKRCRSCASRMVRIVKLMIFLVTEGDQDIRTCSKCHIEKSFDCFGKDLRGKFGLEAICKECKSLRAKKLSQDPQRKARKMELERKRKALPEVQARQLSAQRARRKKQYAEDPEYRLSIINDPRHRLRLIVKNKNARPNEFTKTLLGCSPSELRQYLETKFEPGMTWSNHGKGKGKWNVDHIRPRASFDLTVPEQQKTMFSFYQFATNVGK